MKITLMMFLCLFITEVSMAQSNGKGKAVKKHSYYDQNGQKVEPIKYGRKPVKKNSIDQKNASKSLDVLEIYLEKMKMNGKLSAKKVKGFKKKLSDLRYEIKQDGKANSKDETEKGRSETSENCFIKEGSNSATCKDILYVRVDKSGPAKYGESYGEDVGVKNFSRWGEQASKHLDPSPSARSDSNSRTREK